MNYELSLRIGAWTMFPHAMFRPTKYLNPIVLRLVWFTGLAVAGAVPVLSQQSSLSHSAAQRYTSPVPTGQRAACWAPRQLLHRSVESKVRRDFQGAYRPLPRSATQTHRAADFGKVPRGHVLRRVNLPPDQKLVAFTFDLCEQPFEISGYQGDIVDYLRKHKVPATFFASGKWLLTHPVRAKQVLADPLFEIGNHAWEHRNFRVISSKQQRAEIAGSQRAYQKTYSDLTSKMCFARPAAGVVHHQPARRQTLFRFPFGACTPGAIAQVQRQGLMAIQWDVSSSDPWTGQSVRGMVKTVMRQVRSGSIVLFHANGRGWKTGGAIPILVRRLRAQGYKFVTISQLMEAPGAQLVTSAQCYDSRLGDVNRYDKLARRIEAKADRFYAKFSSGGSRRAQPIRNVSYTPAPAPPTPKQAVGVAPPQVPTSSIGRIAPQSVERNVRRPQIVAPSRNPQRLARPADSSSATLARQSLLPTVGPLRPPANTRPASTNPLVVPPPPPRLVGQGVDSGGHDKEFQRALNPRD